MECCHGEWDISKTPISKSAGRPGCSALQHVYWGVVLAELGAEPELRAKRGEGGKLGVQILSLPLTFAESLRNNMEPDHAPSSE